MRTTIDLPDGLYREAKLMAVKQGTTLKELVVGLIRAGLSGVPVAHGSPVVRRDPPPVAIGKVPGQAPTQPLSNRRLVSLLEEEELLSGVLPDRARQCET